MCALVLVLVYCVLLTFVCSPAVSSCYYTWTWAQWSRCASWKRIFPPVDKDMQDQGKYHKKEASSLASLKRWLSRIIKQRPLGFLRSKAVILTCESKELDLHVKARTMVGWTPPVCMLRNWMWGVVCEAIREPLLMIIGANLIAFGFGYVFLFSAPPCKVPPHGFPLLHCLLSSPKLPEIPACQTMASLLETYQSSLVCQHTAVTSKSAISCF